jgi:hypothetical protein
LQYLRYTRDIGPRVDRSELRWIEARGEGAVYSPDGMRIQFDDGRVWQRDIGPPVVVRRAPVVYTR